MSSLMAINIPSRMDKGFPVHAKHMLTFLINQCIALSNVVVKISVWNKIIFRLSWHASA